VREGVFPSIIQYVGQPFQVADQVAG